MRLNVTQPVLDYEGKPLMVNQTNTDGSPVMRNSQYLWIKIF